MDAGRRYVPDMADVSDADGEHAAPTEQATPTQTSRAGPERVSPAEPERHERPQGMVPGRAHRRLAVERGFMRTIATGGVIGVATILGAVLVSQDVAGWIVGLTVGLTSVILAALLWSSRQL